MSEPAWIEGAGNRFALLDALSGGPPADPPGLARALGSDPRRADGLLVLDRDASGRLAMTVWNRDGSRPEACGNGLRCLARYAAEAGHAPIGRPFEIATDAGVRRAVVSAGGGTRVSMGRPRRLGEHAVELGGERVRGIAVDLGNPHLVLPRRTLCDAEVAIHGARLERDPRFPGGTNVEFVVAGGSRLVARVWERGVGETAACGTGACAAAAVLAASLPAMVELPGGVLEVSEEDGELWLAGPVAPLGAG